MRSPVGFEFYDLITFLFSELYATVGCHPTRSAEFDKFKGGPEGYFKALDKLISENLSGEGRAVAVGECGLGMFPRINTTYIYSGRVLRL